MLLLIFVAVTPLIVFFGVFFLVMNRFEKLLPPEEQSVHAGYYVAGLILAAVPAIITLVLAYVIAFNLERQFGAMSVQAALDEQCGKGHYVADAKGYDGDPFPSWYGQGVTCELMSGQQDWICDCSSSIGK